MNMNEKDNNQKGGAPVPPSFGGEKPTPPTPPAFDGGAKPTPPPFGGAPKSAPAPPPVPASAKAEAQPVAEEAEEMTTSSKKKRTKSVTDKPKKKKKGCMAKGCMWSFIVFLFLGVIGVVFGEDESNKPAAPESSTAKVEQTTAADDEARQQPPAVSHSKAVCWLSRHRSNMSTTTLASLPIPRFASWKTRLPSFLAPLPTKSPFSPCSTLKASPRMSLPPRLATHGA